MNYTQHEVNGQYKFSFFTDFLLVPSFLEGFINTETTIETAKSQRTVYCFDGTLGLSESNRICSHCGKNMHINNHANVTLWHLCFGSNLSCVKFKKTQFLCPECHSSSMQSIPFKADGHFMTHELYQYTRDLLAHGTYTLKQVAEITGLGRIW